MFNNTKPLNKMENQSLLLGMNTLQLDIELNESLDQFTALPMLLNGNCFLETFDIFMRWHISFSTND